MYLFLLVFLSFSQAYAAYTELSPQEINDIEKRLEDFYSPKLDTQVMNRPTVKYDVFTSRPAQPNSFLSKNNNTSTNLLVQQAGAKSSTRFQKNYCEKFLKKYFPKIQCPTEKPQNWSTFHQNDHLKDLTRTWVEPNFELDMVPTRGEIMHDAWSDDYWRTKWGQTSYRYAINQFNPMKYSEAIRSSDPIGEWTNFRLTLPEEVSKKVLFWSPSEKYDLTVGDSQFSLTQQQKDEGKNYVNEEGDVEGWMGLCHGWAPAALMTARPMKPVTAKSANNVDVTWYPNDIKAMVTLAWANGTYQNNFIGGRCNVKNPETLRNGRLKQQECFDTNPATFHLALGNMIGRARIGLVYDKSFDFEVWNQPIISYETTYFNPLRPQSKSKDWREVAVRYDWRFKRQDRFQTPLSRGRTTAQSPSYDDSRIEYIVGAITTVVYLAEIRPDHTDQVQEDRAYRETYTYDLEVEEVGGKLMASGGEWHENSHPDFLWVPQKDAIPSSDYDNESLSVDLGTAPTSILTETAQLSSRYGNPLCRVIKSLIKESTGTDSYQCPQ